MTKSMTTRTPFITAIILSIYVLGAAHLSAQTPGQSHGSNDLVFQGAQSTWPVHQLRPLLLSDGRMVLSVANTVYMLDANGKQLWKYANETLTSEPAFNAARNEVAVVMYDLQAVRLDGTTGKVKWKADSVGRGVFASVSSYGKGFLVVVDMSGYREAGGPASPTSPDRLEYWGESENDFWYIDFPRHADLVVNGKTVYALHHSADGVHLRTIHVPARSKPH
jgi:hypothetical protein